MSSSLILIFIQNSMMYHDNIIDTGCYLRTTHSSLNSQMTFGQEYEIIEKNMEALVLLCFTEKYVHKIQKTYAMCTCKDNLTERKGNNNRKGRVKKL